MRLYVAFVFFYRYCHHTYLNQAGPQPRERDYSYVGSFYAFSIWIGLGVLYVYELFEEKIKTNSIVRGSRRHLHCSGSLTYGLPGMEST